MVPLTVRSHYSLMWGTASIRSLCDRARRYGHTCLALTDTDNLYGLWPFVHECRRQGITPVIGAELTDPATPDRAVCLVKTAAGYANLCRLITRRKTDTAFSLKDHLPYYHAGLIVLTGMADMVAAWHDTGVDVAAALPRHPLHQRHPLYQAARRYQIPLVATPGSFFLDPADHSLHRILRAIDRNTAMSRLDHWDAAPCDAAFFPPDHYQNRFAVLPEALNNAAVLARSIAFTQPDFGTVMPPWKSPDGETASEQLRRHTLAGAKKRYGTPLPPAVKDRIRHELAIIRDKQFCTYFLVVQQIVEKSTRICGRGSGAASIVAYCLGITNVCPVKYNLYFERFLNPGRTDPPDIDIDFAWDERDGILDDVLTRFRGHAAMVASHVLFQPRMAVREVARVFGLPDGETSRISKKLPWFWKLDEAGPGLLDQIRERPEFRFMDFPDPWPDIMALARQLVGTPRHLSVHPGGVVITPDPIDTYVPIETAPKGVPLLQWEKDAAEDAGLVKIDLLGNRSLGVIRDAVASIQHHTGNEQVFDMDPEDDPDTQHNVAQGHTMGCFYIESPAMRLLQKKSRVGDFEHVVIHSSIIRPAANEFIKDYLQRLHSGVWKPPHPLLADVLNETFGIMVYQEDVSKVAVKLAGFSHDQADGLRKIMSKKDKYHALKDYYQRFRNGAAANGVCNADIQAIWEMITSFSGYSFCKPHSASYARVSFQAAFLKTHYPAEFMAAVISNQGGFYSTFAYVSEARRLGLDILGPDIRNSQVQWTGQDRQLRVGLMAVKGLSEKTMAAIARQRHCQAFTSAADFFSRVRPREGEIRALVHAGALDGFITSGGRAGLIWQFACRQDRQQQSAGEPGLFQTPVPDRAEIVPELPPQPAIGRLRKEYRVLGFLCSTHPIVLFQSAIDGSGAIKACDIHGHIGRRIRFAGWLITGKSVLTKHGDLMKFLTFEDDTGLVETVFFPKAFARLCHMLDNGRPYLLSGTVASEWGAVTLTVTAAQQLST